MISFYDSKLKLWPVSLVKFIWVDFMFLVFYYNSSTMASSLTEAVAYALWTSHSTTIIIED